MKGHGTMSSACPLAESSEDFSTPRSSLSKSWRLKSISASQCANAKFIHCMLPGLGMFALPGYSVSLIGVIYDVTAQTATAANTACDAVLFVVLLPGVTWYSIL